MAHGWAQVLDLALVTNGAPETKAKSLSWCVSISWFPSMFNNIFSSKSALMHTKIFSLSVLKTCCPFASQPSCVGQKTWKNYYVFPNRAKFDGKPFIFEPTTIYKDVKQVSKFCHHQISRLHHLLGRPGVLPQGRLQQHLAQTSVLLGLLCQPASLRMPKPNCLYRFGLSVHASLCLHRSSVRICV